MATFSPLLPHLRQLAVLVLLMLGTGAAGARVDGYGDPLPPGAVARIGSVRWWGGRGHLRLVYAPDGKSLVLCDEVGIIHFLDAKTGKELRRIKAGDDSNIPFVFSPDGKTGVTGGVTGNLLRLWDVATGRQLREIADAEIDAVALAFSPDGKTFAAATRNPDIHLWDVATWKETRTLMAKNARDSDYLFFLADGKTLISGDAASIRWWDIRTGREIRRLDKDTTSGAYWQTIASDGKRLAAVESWENRQRAANKSPDRLQLWDAASGKEISRISLGGRIYPGSQLCFSPDGQTLACSCGLGFRGNRTLIFAAATGRPLRHWDDSDDFAFHLIFSPDGKFLLQQNMSGVLHFRDAVTGKRIRPRLGLPDYLLAMRFSPNGKTLIATTADGQSGFFDPLTGQQLGSWQPRPKDFVLSDFRPHRDWYSGIALTADGAKTAMADAKGVLHVWETATGKTCCRIADPPFSHTKAIFSPDGRFLALDHKDKLVRLWDTTTGKLAYAFPNDGGGYCHLFAFSPDGRILATALIDGWGKKRAIRLWESATGKEMGRLTWAGDERALALLFSPESKHLVVALAEDSGKEDARCSVRVWDVARRRERSRIAMPENAGQQDGMWYVRMVISPDGKTLATTTKDSILLWELASGKERGQLIGHRERIRSLAFSPDGRLLASASRDHTALVWDVTGMCPDGKWSSRAAMPAEMERLWTDLAGGDSGRAYRAVWTLAVAGRQAVPFLAQHFRPVSPVAEERLARLIADLDNDRFETRHHASKELEALAELAEPALRKALAHKPSLEVRRRLHTLLELLENSTLSSEQLRDLRAMEVLEQIGTSEARQVLEALAKGAPATRRTREARMSLERLAKRHSLKP